MPWIFSGQSGDVAYGNPYIENEVNGFCVNQYASEDLVPYSVETIINSYEVPTGKTLHIDAILCTGSFDARFNLKINGNIKSTIRNSPSFRTQDANFARGQIIANSGDIVVITAMHEDSSSQKFESNIFGRIFN